MLSPIGQQGIYIRELGLPYKLSFEVELGRLVSIFTKRISYNTERNYSSRLYCTKNTLFI